jgi:hypothetical protein
MPGLDPQVLAVEALQEQIAKDRQARIDEHKRAIAAREQSERTALQRLGPGPLNIFADGDSWFEYPPCRDTIGWVQAGAPSGTLVLNLAHHGDATTEMLGVTKRQRIIDNLTDPGNGRFDAMLFSGGGNDIAGDQFCLWVRQFAEGSGASDGLDSQRLADMLGVIEAAYIDLIGIRDSLQSDCILFLHGYDFAQPTGKGVCGFGPWLKPSLDYRGWTQFALAAGVVKEALLAFDRLLVKLEQQHPNVVYVRTQGILDPASDWANELHPTREGFHKIAGAFMQALRLKFPDRI